MLPRMDKVITAAMPSEAKRWLISRRFMGLIETVWRVFWVFMSVLLRAVFGGAME